jgi:hypothetical protein
MGDHWQDTHVSNALIRDVDDDDIPDEWDKEPEEKVCSSFSTDYGSFYNFDFLA